MTQKNFVTQKIFYIKTFAEKKLLHKKIVSRKLLHKKLLRNTEIILRDTKNLLLKNFLHKKTFAQEKTYKHGVSPRSGSNPAGRTIFEVQDGGPVTIGESRWRPGTMGDQDGGPWLGPTTLGTRKTKWRTGANGGSRWRPATMGDLYYSY